jgi:hypothetical protein
MSEPYNDHIEKLKDFFGEKEIGDNGLLVKNNLDPEGEFDPTRKYQALYAYTSKVAALYEEEPPEPVWRQAVRALGIIPASHVDGIKWIDLPPIGPTMADPLSTLGYYGWKYEA